MRRRLIFAAGFAALYLALAGVSLGPLFATAGVSDTAFGIATVAVIALIPVTAILFTMIGRLRLWNRPARRRTAATLRAALPEIAAAPATSAKTEPHHAPFEFVFAAWNGIDSEQAIERLSAHLTALDIAHGYDGAITVEDCKTRWHVAPVAGELRLKGWSETPDSETRTMIEAAIAEFLTGELDIRLEKLAA